MSIIQEALKKSQARYAAPKGNIYDNIQSFVKTKKMLTLWLASSIAVVIIAAIAVLLFLTYVVYRISPVNKDMGNVSPPAAQEEVSTVFEPVAQSEPAAQPRPAEEPPKPAPAAVVDVKPAPSFMLNGVMYIEEVPKALINGYIVGKGDSINGAKVVEIGEDFVLLDIDNAKTKLRINE